MGERPELEHLNPAEEILVTWAAFVAAVQHNRLWGDARNCRNAIIDSEALLVLLQPEMEIARFGLESTDGQSLSTRDRAVARVLSTIAAGRAQDEDELPTSVRARLLEVLTDYYVTHGADTPTFSAGEYLLIEPERAPEVDRLQKDVQVVDAYTFGLTASLATLHLVKRWFPNKNQTEERYQPVATLRNYAERRLTCSLRGLVDSFAVYSQLTAGEWRDQTRLRWPEASVRELSTIRAQIAQMRKDIGSKLTYEIGWSWGPVPPMERLRSSGREYPYYAEAAPYLYFTVVALDGIKDLSADWVLYSDLLEDPEQQELAQTLRQYADMTERYWSALAGNDVGGRWALQNIPWSTSDGVQSDYWTLYLLRVALPGLTATPHDTRRLIGLLEELAQRARITRAPVPPRTDPAIALHWPGLDLLLAPPELASRSHAGANSLPTLKWTVFDFAPQLLKVAGQLLRTATNHRDRSELISLIGRIWLHLAKRRNSLGVWDRLDEVYPEWYEEVHKQQAKPPETQSPAPDSISTNNRLPDMARPGDRFQGSWYLTQRVIEALVMVHHAERVRPLVPTVLEDLLFELVAELEYQVASLPIGSGSENLTMRKSLHEARQALLGRQPARAFELLIEVLAPQSPGSKQQ